MANADSNTAVSTNMESPQAPLVAAPQQPSAAMKIARPSSVSLIDPSDMFRATKSVGYSQYVMDFITDTGVNPNPYTRQQLLMAYMSSVYLYAAINRVANLISRARIVAEIKKGDHYERAPETLLINQIFQQQAPDLLSRMYLNFALYGTTAVYKVKTRKAVLEEARGTPIYDYKDDAVAGLYALDRPQWELDEDSYTANIKGLFVNQTNTFMGDRNYLNRREFVYYTTWNPERPNEGRSIVTVAIHEAVSNAAIARWMSDYFTRGAMPFIMVSMNEDPSLMTETDMRKYKRQFEDHWQGINSSLRSVWFDRSVTVQQVGIPASEVDAANLNATALEGISAAVGLDRELIVTPSGGSQERHALLIKRAWQDVVQPMAEKFIRAFNEDLGLPSDLRLVLDLSHIAELEAERAEQSSTEISLFDAGIQTYNETRARLNMPPIPDLEGWMNIGGSLISLEKLKENDAVLSEALFTQVQNAYDAGFLTRSKATELLGMEMEEGDIDGYKADIESYKDQVMSLWDGNIITRSQVGALLGVQLPEGARDGFKTEIENAMQSEVDAIQRRNDEEDKFSDLVMQMWSDDLLTKSEVLSLMGFTLPHNERDGVKSHLEKIYDMEIEIETAWRQMEVEMATARQQNAIDNEKAKADKELEQPSFFKDLYDGNILKRSEVRLALGYDVPLDMPDGFAAEIEATIEAMGEAGIFKNRIPGISKRPPEIGSLPSPLTPPPSGGGSPALPAGGGEEEFPSMGSSEGEAAALPAANLVSEENGIPAGDEETQAAQREIADELGVEPPANAVPAETTPAPAAPASAPAPAAPPPAETTEPEEEGKASLRDGVTAKEEVKPSLANMSLADFRKATQANRKPRRNMTQATEYFRQAARLPVYVSSLPVRTVKASFGTPGLTALLDLANNEDIKVIQQYAIDRMGHVDNIRWTTADQFHITMAFSDLVGDNNMKQISSYLSLYPYGDVKVRANKFGVFTKDNYDVLYIEVEKSEDIQEMQRIVFDAFASAGCNISQYSNPEKWNPHITLAYIPKGTGIPSNRFVLEADPLAIILSRENYSSEHYIAVSQAEGNDLLLNSDTDIQNYMDFVAILRRQMERAIDEWVDTGSADKLNKKLLTAIKEMKKFVDEGKVQPAALVDACKRAIADGWFDDYVVWVENPLLHYLFPEQDATKAKNDFQLTPDMLSDWAKRMIASEDSRLRSLVKVTGLQYNNQ